MSFAFNIINQWISRYWLSALQIFFSLLTWIGALLTIVGLVLSAALKENNLANIILENYPRYNQAQDALDALGNFQFSVNIYDNQTEKTTPKKVAAIDIDDPSWDVIRDFIESETAIRKSPRTEPKQPTTPFDIDRIKAVAVLPLSGSAEIFGKPLTPQYNLNVVWNNSLHVVYEIYSFEEFRLDFRKMLVEELESRANWIAVIAFLCSIPAHLLEKLTSFWQKKINPETEDEH